MPSYSARTSARSSARKSPRLSYYAEARRNRSATAVKTPAIGLSLTAKYDFHHVDHDPYQAVSFTDVDKSWRLLTTRDNHIRIPKSKIVRIEPISDERDYRTWIDSSGRFSTVAKYIELKMPLVELEKLEGRRINLPVARLSEVDQEYIRQIED